MHVYKHKHTLTHSHLERKRGPLMPGLGLHIQRACKEKSSHPALTLTPLSREKDRGVSGVSLLKGSGNFHSRVLLKLPRFTFLKPVLTNLLQNPNFVLIPPSLPIPPFLIHPVLACPFWRLTCPFIVEVSVEPDFFYLWVSVGDVISKAESYSTANQHLLVKKLLLVILMITIIVNMVSFFFTMHTWIVL